LRLVGRVLFSRPGFPQVSLVLVANVLVHVPMIRPQLFFAGLGAFRSHGFEIRFPDRRRADGEA